MGFSVYGIVDPRTKQFFYIGQTSEFELRCHQHEEGGQTIAGLVIQEIQAAGLKPVFVVLEQCSERRQTLMAEVFWIDLMRSRGITLTNAQSFEGYAARAEHRKALRTHGTLEEGLDLESLAKGRPLREGRRWSRKEEAMMRRLLREGESIYEVADRLDRSVGAIVERQRRPSQERSPE
ncbi:MAG: hypothetical protein B7Y80_17065 [Hyphomicrobium sp. 32-62-53]|nr:MAG: hypothetical protein B7Z29_08170 [Hyphomicrobium sp. 12-62-95]OYX98086.1 MAG: hypothetical protein B7Y80_17065 [Hyphomicrobium sp. 32-62-53]